VCGVTAAVLGAGLIVATTAGADTTPDVPAMPALALPDVPSIPQVPAEPAGPDQNGPGTVQQDVARGGRQDGRDDTGGGRGRDVQHGAGDAAPGTSAADRTPRRPAGPAQDRDRPAAADTAADAPARPAAQRAPGTTAGAQRDVSPASMSTSPSAPLQQQVLALVNENRRRGGCDDLSLDRRLILAAYGHAVEMARRGYFAHESLNGDGAGDRVSEAGYSWRRYGENIARGQDSAYEVVDGWMHSPEHRENIMDCQLEQMGIGLAFAPDRTPYWVQDFATPR
jgi:uncharacterized protein YkwD